MISIAPHTAPEMLPRLQLGENQGFFLAAANNGNCTILYVHLVF